MSPVPGHEITTPYGKRGPSWSCSPDAKGNGIHTGVDYAAPTGTRVVAARPGVVNHVNHGSAFGSHQIDVIAGDGTRDFYAHMSWRIADGEHVEAGDTVGEVGSEGNSSGSHLHFERHATETGPWSCSIHRDPKPSINYQDGNLTMAQIDDIYAKLKSLEKQVQDCQTRLRGADTGPGQRHQHFDMLQGIDADAHDTQLRVRGPADRGWDQLQDIQATVNTILARLDGS